MNSDDAAAVLRLRLEDICTEAGKAGISVVAMIAWGDGRVKQARIMSTGDPVSVAFGSAIANVMAESCHDECKCPKCMVERAYNGN